MVINVDAELETAICECAKSTGFAPQALALKVLKERFLHATSLQPRDEWERGLLAVARAAGVSLPDAALSSEGLYD